MAKKHSSAGENPIVWLDLEMTGLVIDSPDSSAVRDEIVEVGVIVTDGDLNPVDAGLNLVVKPSDAALANMNSFVRDMHTSSGLLGQLADGVSVQDAEKEVLAYITKNLPNGRWSAPMGGNTIAMDRRFLATYMPSVEDFVHYRSIDVSSIKELLGRWFPYIIEAAPKKLGNHRALADALDSIRELAYYRNLMFSVSSVRDDKIRSAAEHAAGLFTDLSP